MIFNAFLNRFQMTLVWHSWILSPLKLGLQIFVLGVTILVDWFD